MSFVSKIAWYPQLNIYCSFACNCWQLLTKPQTWSMFAMILSNGGVPVDSVFDFNELVLGPSVTDTPASVPIVPPSDPGAGSHVLCAAADWLLSLLPRSGGPSEAPRGFNLPKHRLHQCSTFPLSGWKGHNSNWVQELSRQQHYPSSRRDNQVVCGWL